MDSPHLYDVKGAAAYLQVSVSAVYKWVKAGVLEGKQYGSVWRFTKEQLDNPKPAPDTAPKQETPHGREIPRKRRELVL